MDEQRNSSLKDRLIEVFSKPKYFYLRWVKLKKPFVISNKLDAIRRIAESVKIPIIANGASDEINTYEDVIKFRDDCGAASVMLARAAQRNISIFRKEGFISSQPFQYHSPAVIFCKTDF